MSIVRVHNFGVSLDGIAAGEPQTLDAPFGHAGASLVNWFFPTRFGQQNHMGVPPGPQGVDNAFAEQFAVDVGAEIMGRNKFQPRDGAPNGEFDEDAWRGWWGENPVFHTPVFVLTHRPRPSLEMEGGTTFHFIDASPAEALEQAKAAAGGADVRIGGGATTVREFLAADLIDHMHLVVVPIVLGRGTKLWDGLEGVEKRFDVETVASPSGVVHMTFTRRR